MKLTPAMVRALEVLEAGPARYSNFTARGAEDPDGNELGRSVYWQSAASLSKAGLARNDGTVVTITDDGRAALEEHRGR